MTRRFRHIAALFALIALTALTVQGLWASTCVMGAGASVASAEVSTSAETCTHGATAVIERAGPSPSEGPSNDSHCPFMPMSVAGSCGAVLAMPAESHLSLEPSSPEALLLPWPTNARDLLLAAAFFRPPIA